MARIHSSKRSADRRALGRDPLGAQGLRRISRTELAKLRRTIARTGHDDDPYFDRVRSHFSGSPDDALA